MVEVIGVLIYAVAVNHVLKVSVVPISDVHLAIDPDPELPLGYIMDQVHPRSDTCQLLFPLR